MELKNFLREYKRYNKERIKKIILYSIIGFYLLFLFYYNLNRQYGINVQLSWNNGIISALITTLIYNLLIDFLGFLLKLDIMKGKLRLNLILALIGGFMLLFAGLIGTNNLNIKIIMTVFPWVFFAFLMPIILSIIGLLGIILVLLGKNYGRYPIFIAGLVAVSGMYITIYTDSFNNIALVLTLIYIDPFLLLIGGTLSFTMKIAMKKTIRFRLFIFAIVEFLCITYLFVILRLAGINSIMLSLDIAAIVIIGIIFVFHIIRYFSLTYAV
ncbi:MAG: hypothetical protein ACFFBH_13135 [Promethearchaeota archaeon]